MNGAVLRATVRERLSGVLNLAFMVMLLVLPSIASHDGLTEADSIIAQLGLTLVVCAGAIGREVAAGTLALVFCRPIRRSDYVLTKWLTLASIALVWGLVQLTVQCLVCKGFGHHVAAATVAQNVFERFASAFGVAAVMVLFSTFTRGSLDIGLWLLAFIVASVSYATDYKWLGPVGKELRADLAPQIHYWHTFHSHPIVWSELFAYGASVSVCLALACWVMCRKEVSYAS